MGRAAASGSAWSVICDSHTDDLGSTLHSIAEEGDRAMLTATKDLICRPLAVTDECVFLERAGQRELLIWPANTTRWLSETGEIQFRRADGDVVTVGDRQFVELGGGGLSLTLDGLNGVRIPRRIDWVAEPDGSCVAIEHWLVSDVIPG